VAETWVERLGKRQTNYRLELEKLRQQYERTEPPPPVDGGSSYDLSTLFPEFREWEKTQHPSVSPEMAFSPYAQRQPLYNPFSQQRPPLEPPVEPPVELPPISTASVTEERLGRPDEESKLKDIWDSFYMGLNRFTHGTKQFFNVTMPQMIAASIRPPEEKGIWYSEKQRQKQEELYQTAQEVMPRLQEKYAKQEQKHEQWIKEHPELKPRPEWDRPVMEVLKEDPKILKDPAYWAFIAAESAAYSCDR
jgi:hypothetical protein